MKINIENFKKRSLRPIGVLLFLFIVLSTSLGTYFKVQDIVVSGLLPVIFLLTFIWLHNYLKGAVSKELILFFILMVLSLISVYMSIRMDAFIADFRKLAASFMACTIGLMFGLKKENENYIHIGFIVSSVVLIALMYIEGNFSLAGFTAMDGRRDRFTFNANYYSYISYFANISILYLHLKSKRKITFILALVMPVLFLILAFITQSRSGLLFVLLINVVFWFFINLEKNRGALFKILRFATILTIGLFLSFQFINIYLESNIAQRFSQSGDDSRSHLAKRGIELFMDYPFSGIGLGQFPFYNNERQFSHNSYAEVLSEHGFIGGMLLFLIFFMPFFKSYSIFKKNSNNQILKMNLLFFSTFLLYNNFFVFYKFPYAMLYFFMFVGLQYRYRNVSSKKTQLGYSCK